MFARDNICSGLVCFVEINDDLESGMRSWEENQSEQRGRCLYKHTSDAVWTSLRPKVNTREEAVTI